MHIEPGVVDGAKMTFAYTTAAGAATYTASDNTKLITLFEKHGYALSRSSRPDMVILSRVLDGAAAPTSNAVKS